VVLQEHIVVERVVLVSAEVMINGFPAIVNSSSEFIFLVVVLIEL